MGQAITVFQGVATLVATVVGIFQQLKKPPKGDVLPVGVASPPVESGLTPEQIIGQARGKLGIDVVRCYNIVLCGESGSGKSSTIRAIRGQPHTDRSYPRVGVIEQDIKLTPYPMSDEYRHVVLWDSPGGGTTLHPRDTYFSDNMLYAFDCLLIVTSSRFTELDLAIARSAADWGVPFVFVRTKADEDLRSLEMSYPDITKDQLKEKLRSAVHDNIIPQLTQHKLEDRRLFIISSWAYLDDSIPSMDEAALLEHVTKVALQRRPAHANVTSSDE